MTTDTGQRPTTDTTDCTRHGLINCGATPGEPCRYPTPPQPDNRQDSKQ